ncbi:MAG: trypsin-like peptidase domain-containing protein [Planctomycetota bacterium]
MTVFSYGQNSDEPATRENNRDDSAKPKDPPIGPSPPLTTEDDGLPLTGLGSGVLVESSGWIITNNHVINDAKRVIVQLPDETEWRATEVHGDAASDIAVLKIDHDERLPALQYGDSDRLEIGDWVLAIGSPFKLEATVSAGIISAKNRTLGQIRRGRLLQTDAAINPGNSGGPLIDLDGRLIAISTAIATRNGGYQGIGFAIPANQARWIAKELAKHGRVRRAAMGIRLAELNPKLARRLKLDPYLGVLIYQVINDSAADRAGLKSLDVILEFAGVRVRKPGELQEAVEREPIGSTQQVKIQRNGKMMFREIVLAPLEDPTRVNQNDQSESKSASKPATQETLPRKPENKSESEPTSEPPESGSNPDSIAKPAKKISSNSDSTSEGESNSKIKLSPESEPAATQPE